MGPNEVFWGGLQSANYDPKPSKWPKSAIFLMVPRDLLVDMHNHTPSYDLIMTSF